MYPTEIIATWLKWYVCDWKQTYVTEIIPIYMYIKYIKHMCGILSTFHIIALCPRTIFPLAFCPWKLCPVAFCPWTFCPGFFYSFGKSLNPFTDHTDKFRKKQFGNKVNWLRRPPLSPFAIMCSTLSTILCSLSNKVPIPTRRHKLTFLQQANF